MVSFQEELQFLEETCQRGRGVEIGESGRKVDLSLPLFFAGGIASIELFWVKTTGLG
jgi:hypothetical protein